MVNLKQIAIAATRWSANRIDVFRVGFNSDLQRKSCILGRETFFQENLQLGRLLKYEQTSGTVAASQDGSPSAESSVPSLQSPLGSPTVWTS